METVLEKAWSKSKILIKALIIGALVLLLLIPTFYVKNLIEEREQRQKEAISEVSNKWAGKQNLAGPIIILPYMEASADTTKGPIKSFAYFLPDNLEINSTVVPQERSRGIYKVMLYSSINKVEGSFKDLPLEQLKINEQNVLWSEAGVLFNISDPKGLNEELKIKWKDSTISLSPHVDGFMGSLKITGREDLENISFSTEIDLNGSEKILFSPVGKTTTVNLHSNWEHPSYRGDILPQTKAAKDSGFTATWKSMAHKRNFPQQWKNSSFSFQTYDDVIYPARRDITSTTQVTPMTTAAYDIGASAFGVDLYIPVNGYQKTLRSIKYAMLCILLTFCAFFLIETVNRKPVHPFQYGLVGLALIMFYTLLLSFSEYMGFNLSYAIASVCTIGLISWFVKGILTSGKLSMILSVVLVLLYSFIFSLLQLQDYALLLGSIGLFIALGVVMYFSRKLQW